MIDIPDVAAPIRAIRAWYIHRDFNRGLGLYSTGVGCEWRKSTLTAVCAVDGAVGIYMSDHVVPSEQCTCGIHACKDLQSLADRIGFCIDSSIVVGTVELSGRVIEHEWGYRAQYAKIVEFYDMTPLFPAIHQQREFFRMVQGFSSKWGIPVTIMDLEMVRMARVAMCPHCVRAYEKDRLFGW